jgi:hypothetical protein
LSTFWSSAFTPPTRRAALAAAAATLNLILQRRVLSQATQRVGRLKRYANRRGGSMEKGRDCL